MTGITPDAADPEAAFAVEVFDMLKKEGKISLIYGYYSNKSRGIRKKDELK